VHVPTLHETLFQIQKSDIVLKDDTDGYYGVNIVIMHQFNGYWRYFAIYNGRIIQTARGDSQAQVHTLALVYLRNRGYRT
jgi:hypothetical protein